MKFKYASIALLAFSQPGFSALYQVHMDNVDSSLNDWSIMKNDIGDLYDSSGAKQVDVAYAEMSGFGNTTLSTGQKISAAIGTPARVG